MKENIVEKSVNYFNNNDINGLADCWHEEIVTYNLKTNKVLTKGKAELKEVNRESTEDNESQITIESKIEVGNIIIIHKSYKGTKKQGVSICEIKDNLIKKVWYIFE